jgi:hypothetical protein
MALQPFVGPWSLFFSFLIFTQSVGLTGREISPSQRRYLHTGQQKQNPQVGFEPTIPVFVRVKTVHTLDGAAILIGLTLNLHTTILISPIYK